MEYSRTANARCDWRTRSLQVSYHLLNGFYSIHRLFGLVYGLTLTIKCPFCRDPRTRRLQEKQLKQQQEKSGDGVPEKLSFKEKMKMFALESGENQTPKDKLKISRAQRDIDAVH